MRPKVKELLDKILQWQIENDIIPPNPNPNQTVEAVDTPIESS